MTSLSRNRSKSAHKTRGGKGPVRYRVGRADEIRPGESHKFMLPIDGVEEECFVVNFRGDFHAYVNRCRHIPIAMDWVDNHFFAEGGRYLMCQTHGALFAPATGECLAGPADTCGKFLFRIPIEIERGLIYARPPGEPVEPGL
jgi:nitrite reductase/ring-hydroxylating ferredoxin subunit